MPAMPRQEGKARKIAYKILGIPLNIQSKPAPAVAQMDKRLNFEYTARVKTM